MKKFLLFSITLFSAVTLKAQSCTPGVNFADSTYGAWPDTTVNFPMGEVNVPYSTDLNFKVPSTVTAEVAGNDPTAQGFIGSPIQGFVVDGVTGLPAGFNYACNLPTCQYTGGANGCANLYGTATATGTYPLVINITATVLVTIPLLGQQPVDVPTSFSGYKLVIGNAGVIEEIIQPFSVHPNPAQTKITLNGLSTKLGIRSISLSNTEGRILNTFTSTTAKTMDIDISMLSPGIYFLNIAHETALETIKFVKE
jgi:hypothetical protein